MFCHLPFFSLQFLEPLEVQLLIMHNSQRTFWFPAQAVICIESPTDRHCPTAVRAIRFQINVGYNDTNNNKNETNKCSYFVDRQILSLFFHVLFAPVTILPATLLAQLA